GLSPRSLGSTDQDAGRSFQIRDRRALGEELWIRQDLEALALPAILEDPLHGLGGPDGQRALLDDDDGALGMMQGAGGRLLPVAQIGRALRPLAEGLGGRVYADEDHLRFADLVLDVTGESEVTAQGGSHDLLQTWLENGRMTGLPRGHPLPVDIGDHDLDGGTVLGDHCHRGAAYVARSDAKNPTDHDDLREGSRRLCSLILRCSPLFSSPAV